MKCLTHTVIEVKFLTSSGTVLRVLDLTPEMVENQGLNISIGFNNAVDCWRFACQDTVEYIPVTGVVKAHDQQEAA